MAHEPTVLWVSFSRGLARKVPSSNARWIACWLLALELGACGARGTLMDGSSVDAVPDTPIELGRSGADGGGVEETDSRFSFFVTSLGAMRDLSMNQDGFGGDLRYGETGTGAGLRGADKLCRTIAERSSVGAAQKEWRAFLSAVSDGVTGGAVNAIDRVGEGPWHDRVGRLVAINKTDLAQDRPRGADRAIVNDLPNEYGIPNHVDLAPGCADSTCNDNHDVLTGTGPRGMLYASDAQYTCSDWTSAEVSGRPRCGHSWPRAGSGTNWMSAQAAAGCAPGINLMAGAGPAPYTVGSTGGYGAIYCFALTP